VLLLLMVLKSFVCKQRQFSCQISLWKASTHVHPKRLAMQSSHSFPSLCIFIILIHMSPSSRQTQTKKQNINKRKKELRDNVMSVQGLHVPRQFRLSHIKKSHSIPSISQSPKDKTQQEGMYVIIHHLPLFLIDDDDNIQL